MAVTILAEKPSQANAYADAFSRVVKRKGYYEVGACPLFPQGAFITWAIGHLVTLQEPYEYNPEWKHWDLKQLPIIPNDGFKFKVSKDKIPQFNIVKKLLKQSESIIIATDCDREGENIALSLIMLSGENHKPTKRLWINSLEIDEVKRGFENLRDGRDTISYYYEAQARQISDWIVGINSSRLFTLLLQRQGIKEAFSVGRVQTPTLKLIYDRQTEIEQFKSRSFFEVEADISTDKGSFKGKYKEKFDKKEEVNQLITKHDIHDSNQGVITHVETKRKYSKAPKLHSLSTLQSLVNKKYKYSPSQVLKTVQSLYDSPLKLVTYPRTDTQYITENEYNYLKDNLYHYQLAFDYAFEPSSLEPNKRYCDSSKVQEHYAIVLTKKIPDKKMLDSLTNEQRNIYFEIAKSVLAMFHHDYIFDETIIQTSVNELIFESKGKVEKSLGWKELFKDDPKDSDNKNTKDSLPNVIEGTPCNVLVNIKEGKTTPPSLYTEGQLINMMKTCGKHINDTNDETKKVLNDIEGLGTEATRSGIIETLKAQKYIEIKKNNVHVTTKGVILCKAVEGTLLSKPDMTAKWESYLNTIGSKQGGNKEQFILNTINFTKDLIQRTKQDIVNLHIDKEVENINKVDGIVTCPSCQKGLIVDKKKFYGCSNYKNGCTQTFSKKILNKNITKSHIKQLVQKGITNKKVTGFKKNEKAKPFDAYLKLVNGEIKLEFKKG